MKFYSCCSNDPELTIFINASASESEYCPFCNKKSKYINFDEIRPFFDSLLSIYSFNRTEITIHEHLANDWSLFSNPNSDLVRNILTELGYNNHLLKCDFSTRIRDTLALWLKLKREIKQERRFTSKVDDIIDDGWDAFWTDKKFQILIQPEVGLYRARIHDKTKVSSSYSKDEMGAPPNEKLSEGRAHPKGIQFLYLCREKNTTFYETRATHLDYVSIATFHSKDKPLKIVDLSKDISLFSSEAHGNIEYLVRVMLLSREIGKDLSRPLHRLEATMEYIPTQYICEFIRHFTGMDGIQFKSSLAGEGHNIVLFNPQLVTCEDKVELYQINNLNISATLV